MLINLKKLRPLRKEPIYALTGATLDREKLLILGFRLQFGSNDVQDGYMYCFAAFSRINRRVENPPWVVSWAGINVLFIDCSFIISVAH